MRKLATIQTIDSILPHDNADSLEIARVLGWNVVVKKGEFKPGDPCVYCEIDSILPERPEFEFLRKSKFRVKTIKLRGQVSQGICFPVSLIENKSPDFYAEGITCGQDVTEFLGVTKYDPEFAANNGMGAARVRNFPGFIVKTDEVRVQNLPRMLMDYKGTLCYVTEKLDGSSFTAFVKDGKVGICSRNMQIDISEENAGNVFYSTAKQYGLFEKLDPKFYEGLAIQGEVIGPKIQGNKYKLQKPELRLFSVLDIKERRYLGLDKLMGIAEALSVPTVPILDTKYELTSSIDELVKMSIAPSYLNREMTREGIVIRSLEYIPEPCRELRELSFKVISPEYLLKYD